MDDDNGAFYATGNPQLGGTGKADGVSVDLFQRLRTWFPDVCLLNEADGSRMRPFKAPAAHEPVIPAETTLVVPVVGADKVARLLAIGLDRIAAAASIQPVQVNGYPALILRLDGEVDTVIAVRIDDGLITGLYAVRNPQKLSHMEQETTLRR